MGERRQVPTLQVIFFISMACPGKCSLVFMTMSPRPRFLSPLVLRLAASDVGSLQFRVQGTLLIIGDRDLENKTYIMRYGKCLFNTYLEARRVGPRESERQLTGLGRCFTHRV